MQLSTLVELLEREMPGVSEGAHTRRSVAKMYAERGYHDAAQAFLDTGSPAATTPSGRRRRNP